MIASRDEPLYIVLAACLQQVHTVKTSQLLLNTEPISSSLQRNQTTGLRSGAAQHRKPQLLPSGEMAEADGQHDDLPFIPTAVISIGVIMCHGRSCDHADHHS